MFLQNKNKETNEQPSLYRKHGDNTLLILIVFATIVVISGFAIYNNTVTKACNNFETTAIEAGFKFALDNNLLPSYEGTSQKINLDALTSWNKEFRNSTCSGTLNIVKTDVGYVTELDLTNCNKCTTSKKKLSSATEEYKKNKNIVRVDITYNYKTREINYTPWTEWLESSMISPNQSEYGVNLPYDEENYPKLPNGGILIDYEIQKKTFYSYRDASWRFYKVANNSYSEFSSTKPTNYAYKDTKTEIKTEQSEWSLNYPEEADYRDIKTATAYKFYYVDEDGTKIYYNNGEYTVKIEDETLAKLYNKKEKETVKMYSYIDTKWKWYNGEARQYSSYMEESTNAFPYKDPDLVKYTSWSRWSETSTINNQNASYRQERTDNHNRYRAKYAFDSNEVLNQYLSLNDFENATGRSISDMQEDENINLLIKYTYQYGK